MIAFLIIGIFAGIILGLRFKVLVLGPATLLVTAAITVSGIASGHEPRMIALTVFGAVASLQIGYFVGSILQVMTPAHLLARTTVRYRPPQVGIIPVDVELERAGVAHLGR
jgi:hypothetical protein